MRARSSSSVAGMFAPIRMNPPMPCCIYAWRAAASVVGMCPITMLAACSAVVISETRAAAWSFVPEAETADRTSSTRTVSCVDADAGADARARPAITAAPTAPKRRRGMASGAEGVDDGHRGVVRAVSESLSLIHI